MLPDERNTKPEYVQVTSQNWRETVVLIYLLSPSECRSMLSLSRSESKIEVSQITMAKCENSDGELWATAES